MGISGNDKALMYALGGVMRGGASRAGYTSPKPFVSIDGVQYAQGRATDSERVVEQLTITESVDATPNTCSFKMRGVQPTTGQEVVVTLGSINNLDRRFGGIILAATAGYVGIPENAEYAVNAIDFSWLLTRTKISKRHTNE